MNPQMILPIIIYIKKTQIRNRLISSRRNKKNHPKVVFRILANSNYLGTPKYHHPVNVLPEPEWPHYNFLNSPAAQKLDIEIF